MKIKGQEKKAAMGNEISEYRFEPRVHHTKPLIEGQGYGFQSFSQQGIFWMG